MKPEKRLWIVIGLVSVTAVLLVYWRHVHSVAVQKAFIDKLKSAKRYKSAYPARQYAADLAKVSPERAALHSVGMELREVSDMAYGGDPNTLFAMLAHLGNFGEVMVVDQWTNFQVKLPPSKMDGYVVPRRDAVKAALNAIEASDGCLINAGENRCVVAKNSDRKQYEAAIRALGWLDGDDLIGAWRVYLQGGVSQTFIFSADHTMTIVTASSKDLRHFGDWLIEDGELVITVRSNSWTAPVTNRESARIAKLTDSVLILKDRDKNDEPRERIFRKLN